MDFSIAISVIMPTYDTETSMLQEAVESILCQTFREFEFIIIDDGSVNGSDDYLRSLRDDRIRLIRNPVNIGITKSLNIGLKAAKGKYIARMDADDIALPSRFEKQYAFMEAHPDVILCGSRVANFNGDTSRSIGNSPNCPKDMETYRVDMLFRYSGPIHPTAFLRHSVLLEHQLLYDENMIYSQDYGLWETISRIGRVYSLDDVLLRYRNHAKQINCMHRDEQIECDKMVQKRLLSALLGSVTDEEVDFHYKHSTGHYPSACISPETASWYARLLKANKQKHIYNQRKLKRRIQKVKMRLVYNSFQRKDISKAEKLRIFLCNVKPLSVPETIVKFRIWKRGG